MVVAGLGVEVVKVMWEGLGGPLLLVRVKGRVMSEEVVLVVVHEGVEVMGVLLGLVSLFVVVDDND